MQQAFESDILQTIGNAPLVKLSRIIPENCADIYVKLEYFNPTGSYKDRMALAIGINGSHHVEGIGTGRIPPLLKRESYNEIRAIEESDARKTAKSLAAEEGIFAGTSTGLNVFAAIQIGMELGPGKTIVTVACDSGMKYLAGDLFD